MIFSILIDEIDIIDLSMKSLMHFDGNYLKYYKHLRKNLYISQHFQQKKNQEGKLKH